MPRIVRDVTLREFVKYNGDIQAAVKGRNRELLGNEDATIDLGTRKRKWVESQESEEKLVKGQQEVEGSRGIKNGRECLLLVILLVTNCSCSSHGCCHTQEEACSSTGPFNGTEVTAPNYQDPSQGTCSFTACLWPYIRVRVIYRHVLCHAYHQVSLHLVHRRARPSL